MREKAKEEETGGVRQRTHGEGTGRGVEQL